MQARNTKRNNINKIPDNIVYDAKLNAAIEKLLPDNYNFEIHKTIARIRLLKAKRIALQMPEGLQLFACIIADILYEFAYEDSQDIDIIIMGDVTYGACCIDDYTSRALNCDLLIHYGHSCLVPLDCSKTFYVFVYISIDTKHFIETIAANFEEGSNLILVSTIQFISTLQAVRDDLSKRYQITIPKSAPLSFGEILGCTAPTVNEGDAIVYLGDGRFHLESVMMANPELPAYRYDPYAKVITREYYDHRLMRINRHREIEKAKSAKTFGIILGTLGRQGSSSVLQSLITSIEKRGLSHVTILLSEVFPEKLAMFGDSIDAFIQIACPRLSIDWGTFFTKPLLTPFEAAVALSETQWKPVERYPMDFYAHESRGNWTPNYRPQFPQRQRRHIIIGGPREPPKKKEVCKEHEWENCTNCTCMDD